MREAALKTPKSVEKEGSASGTGAEIPLNFDMKTRVRELCPCSPWKSVVGQRSHLQLVILQVDTQRRL